MPIVNVTGPEDEEVKKTVKTLAGLLEAVMPKTSESRATVKILVDQGDLNRVVGQSPISLAYRCAQR